MFLWLWLKTNVNHTLCWLCFKAFTLLFIITLQQMACVMQLSALWRYPSASEWMKHVNIKQPETNTAMWALLLWLLKEIMPAIKARCHSQSKVWTRGMCFDSHHPIPLLEACSSSGPFYCNVNPGMEMWRKLREHMWWTLVSSFSNK